MDTRDMSATVTLVTSIRRGPGALYVDFEVGNRSSEAILLYAHPGDQDRMTVRSEEAYVEYLDDDAALHVSLLPPDPSTGDYIAPVPSLARRVGNESSYRGVIRVPLPVEPWSPYSDDGPSDGGRGDRDEAEASEYVEAEVLHFDTGWFPETGVRWIEPGPEPDTFWCTGSPFYVLRHEMPLEPPVPVFLGPS